MVHYLVRVSLLYFVFCIVCDISQNFTFFHEFEVFV
jgi:hypothetical protein